MRQIKETITHCSKLLQAILPYPFMNDKIYSNNIKK